jgi:hypothetical protein
MNTEEKDRQKVLIREVSRLRKELSTLKKINRNLLKEVTTLKLDDEAAKTAQDDFLSDFYND